MGRGFEGKDLQKMDRVQGRFILEGGGYEGRSNSKFLIRDKYDEFRREREIIAFEIRNKLKRQRSGKLKTLFWVQIAR